MNRKVNLMEYIPDIYSQNKTMINIQDTKSEELSNLYSEFEEKTKEIFINLSSDLGLSQYEDILDISRNLKFTNDERRESIKAKLRGVGTTTKTMIKKVSEAYSNGEVEVIEENDKYIVKIKFVGTRGIPSNIEMLRQSLRNIIPAHLEIEYVFTYMTWEEFERYNKTIDEWDSLNLTADNIMAYRG